MIGGWKQTKWIINFPRSGYFQISMLIGQVLAQWEAMSIAISNTYVSKHASVKKMSFEGFFEG